MDDQLILGKDQYYSRNSYETKLNNNVLVIGCSGSGKTTSILRPNIINENGSFVVSDPKGTLHSLYEKYLREKGYSVIEIDFTNPAHTHHFNPIEFCKTTKEINKLAHRLAWEDGKYLYTHDPYWNQNVEILLTAIISFQHEAKDLFSLKGNIPELIELLRKCVSSKGVLSDFWQMLSRLDANMGTTSYAKQKFQELSQVPEKTYNCIISTAFGKFANYDDLEIRELLRQNDLDFTVFGKEKTALFIKVSDHDRTYDGLVNLLYAQIFDSLIELADAKQNDRLEVPVTIYLDDFATNCRIDNFQNVISNIRSRNISTTIFIQSQSQLVSCYGNDSQTIVDNCDSMVYLGGMNPETAREISIRTDKPFQKILNMRLDECIVFRRGQKPVFTEKFNIWEYERKLFGKTAEEMQIEKEETIYG